MSSRWFMCSLVLCAGAAGAEDATPLDPVVVSATLGATPRSEVGSSVTVVSGEEIVRRGVLSVADALRLVPGLDVVSNGGLGKTTSVFMRGAKSEHTLVLIDGIEINDPASVGNSFDFAHLTVDAIERIEVLRGPQSSLYGADAIGGVIQIFTRKGSGKPAFTLHGEGGSYGTWKSGGGVSGGTGPVAYSLNASRLESEGFSTASEEFGNREKDGYRNTTVDARLGYQALDNLDFDFIARYTQARTEEDNWDFIFTNRPTDDPNAFSETEQLFTRGQARLDLWDGRWEQTMGISYSSTERDSRNPFDTAHIANAFDSRFLFNGYKLKGDWRHRLKLHETNTLSFGAETEEEWMDNGGFTADAFGVTSAAVPRHTANATSLYLQDQINPWDFWHTTASVRYDHHNRFGEPITWRVAQVWELGDTGARLKGSYGTGFKAPSLYQLFAPGIDFFGMHFPIGNSSLKAEESIGWDAGAEQLLWDGKAMVGATWFNNRFTNLIDFDFLQGYLNRVKAHSEGVETFAELRPWDNLTLRGGYTYTRTDGGTGENGALLNRPQHKGNFDVLYRPIDPLDLTLNVLLVGRKDSIGGVAGGYAVVNLAASWRVMPQLKLFARVDNLFDKAYQESFGFGTSRLAGYGGAEITF